MILNVFAIFLIFIGCNSHEITYSNDPSVIHHTYAAVCSGEIKKIPYDLSKPSGKYVLPEILFEVSGLTNIDSAHIACVQDELGTVFIYNFKSNTIVFEHKFDTEGDFEGLTYANKTLFILRSDGRLTEWSNFSFQTGGKTIQHSMLPLLTANNEGLCFDSKQNRLLIAAKSKPINHDYKAERFIYEYNLIKNELNPEPAYSINTADLGVIAKKFNIEQNDTTVKGKPRPFNFRPSSLAVHPETSDIYIISASDKLLLVMDKKGNIEHMEELSPELFAKAEGITFLDDGTMIIVNEGVGSAPTMLMYRPKN